MKILLDSINYTDYQWPIFGNLKVIAKLMGMQEDTLHFVAFFASVIAEQALPTVKEKQVS